jgi:oligopeptide transport system substrate-binding protein
MTDRLVRLAWLLTPAVAAMAGCGSPGPSAGAAAPITVGTALAADQTVTRGLDSMPRTLDPSLLTDTEAQKVVDDLFEGLTAIGLDRDIVPGVAASWETSADGKTWVFHLRSDARWSNGDSVTADDFVYAWRRVVDPKTGSEYAQALGPIVGAIAIATGKAPVDTLGVAAPDAHTLRVSLNNPTPYLPSLLADSFMQPLPRATIERYHDDWTRPEHMVSNGAFVLKELIVGDRITVEKNPFYWGAAAVHPTRVIFYPLEADPQIDRFMAGDIQYTSKFGSSQYPWLKARLGDQVHNGPYLGIQMLAFNALVPPFANNPGLRRALSMAIDRRELADKVELGMVQAAYTLVPPLPGYDPPLPEWASWSDERRHAEARRLYAAAGYSKTHPLRINVDYATSEDSRDIFDALAAMWRANLGAEVQPYNEEFRVLLQDLALHKSLLFWNGWIGDYPDPFTFLQLFQTGFEQNFGGYSDARYDALLEAASREPDPVRRYGYLAEAEKRLDAEGPSLPFLYYAQRHLIKPYLKGWRANIQDRSPSRFLYVLEHQGR